MNGQNRHWARWSMLGYMILQMGTGLLGFFEPSLALYELNMVILYSILMVSFSILGILGLFINPKTVMWAIYGMCLATLLHGIMLVLYGSLQTGYRLAAAPLMMMPMAYIWWRYWVLVSALKLPDREVDQ